MTPNDALSEIETIYKFYAVAAPGVPVVEQGRLSQLWRYLDLHEGEW